jgi:predicted nucleic acid-binding protein
MKRFVLDSNLYIEGIRESSRAGALAEFTLAVLPQIVLHAVVVQELLAGAVSEAARSKVYRDLVGPFERRGRILTPTYHSWRRSGEIVSALVERGILSVGGIARSFPNDAVIAASCREQGVTLITRNRRDFERIRKVEQFDFVEPWPQV